VDARSWIRDSDLVAPVRRLLGGDAVAIAGWSAEPIAGGAGETLGVWRVTGEATVDGEAAPFTVILKGWPAPDAAPDPTAWDSPHRELRACASGFLGDLPGGITAPRCLGEMERADGTIWAWMTPMSTSALARWELEHFALVARRMGQFNGAYLAGRRHPRGDWVSHGWTRKWTEAAREAIEHFDDYIGHPLVAQAFPPAKRRRIERLFAERHHWFDAIDELPQTFSHLDAFPRNVFLCPGPDGELQPGLIDWSFAGIAAAGEELVALVSSSVLFGEADGIAIEALDEAVFAAYVEGLRDAGWQGDERLVRMAYTGSLAMRYLIGTLRMLLPVLASGHAEAAIEGMFGITYEAFRERVDHYNAWAHERADEFRGYLAAIPPRHPAVA
jgi:hypothetical protein